jgi:hypothetical protein
MRLGEVGREMAYTLYSQGNRRAAEQALRRPTFGVWFSKEF